MHVLVMATEWPGKSAIRENFPAFTRKFHFENAKHKIYFAKFLEKTTVGMYREPQPTTLKSIKVYQSYFGILTVDNDGTRAGILTGKVLTSWRRDKWFNYMY